MEQCSPPRPPTPGPRAPHAVRPRRGTRLPTGNRGCTFGTLYLLSPLSFDPSFLAAVRSNFLDHPFTLLRKLLTLTPALANRLSVLFHIFNFFRPRGSHPQIIRHPPGRKPKPRLMTDNKRCTPPLQKKSICLSNFGLVERLYRRRTNFFNSLVLGSPSNRAGCGSEMCQKEPQC